MNRYVVLGTPITPQKYLSQIAGNSFCISYYNRAKVNIDRLIELTGSDNMLMLDNGAYSFWRKNEYKPPISYWDGYYEWVADILNKCPQAVAVSPDIIDGSELLNREMALDFSLTFPIERVMPVFHLNESFDYLIDLIEMGHRYLAIGSTKEFGSQSCPLLHKKLKQTFDVINETTKQGSGYARPWIHLLRFQSISHMYDFNSSDSSNVAMNHNRYKNQPNHLHYLTERIKAKARLTSCTNLHVPARLAVESRMDSIRIRHAKAIIKAKACNIDLLDDIPFQLNIPIKVTPKPQLDAEQFVK